MFEAQSLNFVVVLFIYFFLFVFRVCGVTSKKLLPNPVLQRCTLRFFFSGFFSFSFYIWSWSILYMVWGKGRHSFFLCVWIPSYVSTICWKYHWIVLTSLLKINWKYIVGSISEFRSVPLIYVSVFFTNIILFDDFTLYYALKLGSIIRPLETSFSQPLWR